MRILRYSEPHFSEALGSLARRAMPQPQVEQTVREIISAVRGRGDAALLELTKRFGGPALRAQELRLAGKPKVDAATRQAIATAHANVLEFARRSLRKSWSMKNAQGARIGERFDPF